MNFKLLFTGLTLTAIVLLFVNFPSIIWLIALLNAMLLMLLGTGRLLLLLSKSTDEIHAEGMESYPMVSIHIPICSEPPEVVIETLTAALYLDYPNYEIIVLSNNTPQEAYWKPIENFCKSRNIRFYHYPKIEGYKAGALNECLALMDASTEYIFTVDADYKLQKDALSMAVKRITDSKVDVLQFPQHYFNSNYESIGIRADFNHYFNYYSESANEFSAPLPTGTLSLIAAEAIQQVGGWPTESITEDAQLGIKLLSEGFKTSYCNRRIGRGMMPTSSMELRVQRSRWIFGNFQSLMYLLRANLGCFGKKGMAILQLTAWINLLGIPLLIVLSFNFMQVFGFSNEMLLAYKIAVISILIHYCIQFFVIGKSTQYSIHEHILGFLGNTSLGILGAFKWWEYVLTPSQPFKRTNKFGLHRPYSIRSFFWPLLLISSGLLLLVTEPSNFGFGYFSVLLGLFLFLAKFFENYQMVKSTQAQKISMNPNIENL
ncbi:glycosyltransferase [Flavobacteriaceae bacterium TK19130]|nr:glycosyltransferase [Thermobacterium salinum]